MKVASTRATDPIVMGICGPTLSASMPAKGAKKKMENVPNDPIQEIWKLDLSERYWEV